MLSQPIVLIVTDHAEFPHTLIRQWQAEAACPGFEVRGSDPGEPENVSRSSPNRNPSRVPALTIVGPVRRGRLDAVLNSLQGGPCPTVCVAPGRSVTSLRTRYRQVQFVRRDGKKDWAETAVLVADAMLCTREAMECASRVAKPVAAGERDAKLGQQLLEMRHSFNNALTAVLGNAELILLSPGAVSAEVRQQVEIIHTMTLRMHEMMRRLTSLEAELAFAEKESQDAAPGSKRSFVA